VDLDVGNRYSPLMTEMTESTKIQTDNVGCQHDPRSSNKRGGRVLLLILLSVVAIALSVFLHKALPAAFVWVWLIWAIAFFGAAFVLKTEWPRAILFNLAVLAVCLAGAELYFSHIEIKPPSYSHGYRVSDDLLGFSPAKGIQAHSKRMIGNDVLYDVTYTIDHDGLRISPPWKTDGSAGSLLFFGCSFTFGEGLQDNETFPYQVGYQSDGEYRTFNFAFHGYGPNQMLSMIEHGMVQRIVDRTTPRYAFYVAIPDHVSRVAGRVSYDNGTPRYVLDGGGNLQPAGHFTEVNPGAPWRISALTRRLRVSAIYRRFSNPESAYVDTDLSIFLAVVVRSKELLTDQYPGLQFQIILWPYWDEAEIPLYEKVRDGLAKTGIPLHLVEDILPDYKTNPKKYWLSPGDRHPNALANRLVADYVLKNTLSSSSDSKQTFQGALSPDHDQTGMADHLPPEH